jgi:hypothetical protein
VRTVKSDLPSLAADERGHSADTTFQVKQAGAPLSPVTVFHACLTCVVLVSKGLQGWLSRKMHHSA